MDQHSINITPTLHFVSGTFGEIQVAASRGRVLIDADTRNYDTTGHRHCEHALADLSVYDAIELSIALSAAIQTASNAALQAAPTWSDATHAEPIPTRPARRRIAA